MFSFLSHVFAGFTANAFIKIFKGIAQPVLDYYTDKERVDAQKHSVWADALVRAAEADVERNKTAAMERMNSPFILAFYLNVVFWPSLYFTLFWIDTIFQLTWDLPKAPDRLEEFGQYIVITFIGGGSAVFGLTKSAKILAAGRIIGGRK
jgi:hypothetical protein